MRLYEIFCLICSILGYVSALKDREY